MTDKQANAFLIAVVAAVIVMAYIFVGDIIVTIVTITSLTVLTTIGVISTWAWLKERT